jgi:hypothetical protein
VLIGDVAVGKHAVIGIQFLDQSEQIFFGINRNPIRVQLAGQLRREFAAFDARNLSGRKGHHVIGIIVAVIGVEVVEVPSSSSDNDNIFYGIR